jgi:hypothetical protein
LFRSGYVRLQVTLWIDLHVVCLIIVFLSSKGKFDLGYGADGVRKWDLFEMGDQQTGSSR